MIILSGRYGTAFCPASYTSMRAWSHCGANFVASFVFEEHNIRGIKKMKMRVGLALPVMLAVAVGHIKEGRQEMMRSLVSPPKRAA